MSSLSSISKIASALAANQTALQVTAHNVANVNTPGYVRQQVLFEDSGYSTIGSTARSILQLGLGTDVQCVRQVRDIFLDKAYRHEMGGLGFYSASYSAIEEIEAILGELEGESFSGILGNFWESIDELSTHPEGDETRGIFIEDALAFVNRSNLVMDQLKNYQTTLNQKVINLVDEINYIGEKINDLNDEIQRYEINGDQANDYRDQRNALLDRLSSIVDISYKYDELGCARVKIEGRDFIYDGEVFEIGLKEAEPKSLLVKPYWLSTGDDVFDLNETISRSKKNDRGELKSLLIARGTRQANYTDTNNQAHYENSIKPYAIMNAQAQFDVLVHGIVTMINDILAPNIGLAKDPNAPYGLDGIQHYEELFVRKHMDRYDATGKYNQETTTDYNSLYTAGNLAINPALLENYNKLGLSMNTVDVADDQVVKKILDAWKNPFASLEPGTSTMLNYGEYYNSFVASTGNSGNMSYTEMDNQRLMVNQIDTERSKLSGVSSDEEMGNMMKYQHAYNGASRVITVLDEMIEQIVTSLGIVGR